MRISLLGRHVALAAIVVLGAGSASPAFATTPAHPRGASTEADFDEYYGTVAGVQNTKLLLRLRTGRVIAIDASRALLNGMTVLLTPARPIVVHGKVGGDGVLHAKAIWRENAAAAFWPPDGPLATVKAGSP